MSRTSEKGKKVCHKRAKQRNVMRIFPQNLLCPLHHQVQSSCCLHTACCRNNGYNHKHHIYRRSSGLKPEHKSQHGKTKSAQYSQSDTAYSCTDNYRNKDK